MLTLPTITKRYHLLTLSRAKLRVFLRTHAGTVPLRNHAYNLLREKRRGLAHAARLLVLLLLPALASAQPCTPPPSPGPTWVLQDCGWLPPGHPAIRPTTVAECRQYNPYTQPDALSACLARLPETPTAPRTFVLGEFYGLAPYLSTRTILIVGKSLGLDGVEVITAQIVHPAALRGTPLAFRNDGSPEAARWTRVEAK